MINTPHTHAGSPSSTVFAQAQDCQPLQPNDLLPEVALKDSKGKKHKLSDLLSQKRTVLVFYRGGWCPFCNLQLQQLQDIEEELNDLGVQILAISPDSPETLGAFLQEHKLTYYIYSDSLLEAAKAFGIAFQVDEATLDQYREYGIDLEKSSGQTHHYLPIPAVFLVGKRGVIEFSYANPNYKIRLSSGSLLAAVKKMIAEENSD